MDTRESQREGVDGINLFIPHGDVDTVRSGLLSAMNGSANLSRLYTVSKGLIEMIDKKREDEEDIKLWEEVTVKSLAAPGVTRRDKIIHMMGKYKISRK